MTNKITLDLAHTAFRPSSLARTISCTNAVINGGKFKSTTSDAASTGTKIHEIFSTMILSDNSEVINVGDLWSMDVDGHSATYTMTDATKELLEYSIDYCYKFGGDYLYSESRHTNPILLDLYGEDAEDDKYKLSIDALSYNSETKTLLVADLKTGMIPVDAFKNKQLLMYAKSVLHKFKGIKNISLVILQVPNRPSVYNLSVDELNNAYDKILTSVKKTISGDVKPTDTSNCRWCQIKGSCKFYNKQALDAVDKMKELQTQWSEGNISNEVRDEIMELAPLVQRIHKDVSDLLILEINNGVSNGYRLEYANPRRKVSTSKKAMVLLESKGLVVMKPLPIGQLEKVLSEDEISAVTNLTTSKTTKVVKLESKASSELFDSLKED